MTLFAFYRLLCIWQICILQKYALKKDFSQNSKRRNLGKQYIFCFIIIEILENTNSISIYYISD